MSLSEMLAISCFQERLADGLELKFEYLRWRFQLRDEWL